MIVHNDFCKKFNEGVAVFLQQPTRRMIETEVELEDDYKSRRYFLSFPKMVFRVFYAKRQGKFIANCIRVGCKIGNNICYMPLGNIDEDLFICMGQESFKAKTLDELLKMIVSKFWQSEFNDGYDDLPEGYSTDKDFKKWEAHTKKDSKWYPRKFKKVETYKDFIGPKYNEEQREAEYSDAENNNFLDCVDRDGPRR